MAICLTSYTQPSTLQADSTYLLTHYAKREVMIPMRDGVKLYTALYVPKDAGKEKTYPFLMTRTPYSSQPYGPDKYTSDLMEGSYHKLVREGYIIVNQDVRGRWKSEGAYEHVRPQVNEADKKKQKAVDESTDSYDTIEWLVKNTEGNNGKVGVFGVSYPGFYSTTAALSNHPALKAVSPQAPVTDWFIGDDVHHGGAFFLMDWFEFMLYFQQDRKPMDAHPEYPPNPLKMMDNYKFFLKHVPNAQAADDKFFKDSIKFWNDVQAHPNLDAFWKARNPVPHAKQLKPAMLTVGGWFDAEDLYGALKTYEGLENQNPGLENKLVMGPWCHGCWWGPGEALGDISFGQRTGDYYIDSLFLPFMNFHLKAKGAAPSLAEATVFETGANRWRKFSTWPPQGVQNRALFLHPNGKLGWRPPVAEDVADAPGFSEYVSDPEKPVPYIGRKQWARGTAYMIHDQRFASQRPDVLTFETEVLTEDITLTGPIQVKFVASTSGTDADFVVKVVDVYPDNTPTPKDLEERLIWLGGYQQLVRAEILRGRYRNSFEKPEPFLPDEPTPVQYTLPDVCHTFKKGHRLMVQVQSTWFPLVDRNPQRFIDPYTCSPNDYRKATIRVYHTPQKPSFLQLTVLPAN